ncbi:UPF0149 family protein [Gammaproteobacteria bacterium]|nr:UPF0149 family protein [Gammaproteobacteria bacterium]
MTVSPTVHYDELETALSQAGLELSASEAHGVICGSICNQMKTGVSPDLRRVLTAGADISGESLLPLQRQLELLLRNTVENLHHDQVEFCLLLADDSGGLPLRLQSLAEWCGGFVLGLLGGDSLAIDELSTDAAELVRDMLSVSELEVRREGDDSEWDLAEVEEYVRVGVQLIFEELYAGLQSQKDSGELH